MDFKAALRRPIGPQTPQPVTLDIDAGAPDFADVSAAEAWYDRQAGLLAETLRLAAEHLITSNF